MIIEQEPEAWIIVNRDTGYRIQVSYFPDLHNKDMFEVIPLYLEPSKREQDSITDATPMAYMPNGSAVSNVYEAYEEGRKSVMSEQEPVVKITSIHADGENLPVAITGVVLSDAVNIWDLPIKNNDLLFLAPPKREPLSYEHLEDLVDKHHGYPMTLGRAIEKAHGIGGGNE
jgi:hypothetical protein